jgi:hypothetical protein
MTLLRGVSWLSKQTFVLQSWDSSWYIMGIVTLLGSDKWTYCPFKHYPLRDCIQAYNVTLLTQQWFQLMSEDTYSTFCLTDAVLFNMSSVHLSCIRVCYSFKLHSDPNRAFPYICIDDDLQHFNAHQWLLYILCSFIFHSNPTPYVFISKQICEFGLYHRSPLKLFCYVFIPNTFHTWVISYAIKGMAWNLWGKNA